jgi:hypothetical protein
MNSKFVATYVGILLLLHFGLSETTSISALPPSVQERILTIDDDFPKDAIQVTSIKNLTSDNFLNDLSVEMKNISAKPIYYILVYIFFPESKKHIGTTIAVSMQYGNPKLVSVVSEKASAEDVSIAPGDSVTLTLDKGPAKGLIKNLEKGTVPLEALGNLKLFVQAISFGDGTGFYGKTYMSKNTVSPKPISEKSATRKSAIYKSSLTASSQNNLFDSRNRLFPTANKKVAQQNCYSVVETSYGCKKFELQQSNPCCGVGSSCSKFLPVERTFGAYFKVCQIGFCCGDEACGEPVAGWLFMCVTYSLRSCGGSQGDVPCY